MREIKIDFDNPGLPQRLDVVENDAQSRFFKAVLYKDGKAYTAPSGATYSIMYRGFGPQNEGWYDTINDGAGKRAACSVSGNVVTCEIARQALRVPGHVSVVLCVTGSNGYMLHGWPIDCNCRNDSYTSGTSVESFFYITQVTNADWTSAIKTWEELKNMIDPTLSLSGKAADAAKVGEVVNAEAERAKGVEGQIKEDVATVRWCDISTSKEYNLFDKTNINNFFYMLDDSGSIEKRTLEGVASTAPIEFKANTTYIIGCPTDGTNPYWIAILHSNNINDPKTAIRVDPTTVYNGFSYYEYTPTTDCWVSVAFIMSFSDRLLITNKTINYPIGKFAPDFYQETNRQAYMKAAYSILKKIHENDHNMSNNLFDKTKLTYLTTDCTAKIYYQDVQCSENDIVLTNSLVTSIDNGVSIGGKVFSYPGCHIDVAPKGAKSARCYLYEADFDTFEIRIIKSPKSANCSSLYNFSNIVINCLGDSITEGFLGSWTAEQPNFANPTWCQTIASNLGCTVNNYGKSATSICDGSIESFVTRLNSMPESSIDMLFIFGGTNDYGDLRATTLGTINDTAVQGTNFYASFKYLIETAINKYPGAQVCVITPLRRAENATNSNGISMEDIVNAEKEVANYYSIDCLDYYHNSGLNPAIQIQRSTYAPDGIHPNQLGVNTFLAPAFSEYVRRKTIFR